MSLKVKFDTSSMAKSLGDLQQLTGKDTPTILRQSARRVAVNLAFRTQPFGKGEESDLKVSQSKILRDVKRTFVSPSKVYWLMRQHNIDAADGFWRAYKRGDLRALRQLLPGTGLSLEYQRTANPGTHKDARKRGVRKANDWRAFSPNTKSVDRIVQKAQKRAFLAKHGWAEVARATGGVRGISRAVTRKKGISHKAGSAVESGSDAAMSIIWTNHVPYVGFLLPKTEMRMALKREEEVVADLVARALKANARKAGFR